MAGYGDFKTPLPPQFVVHTGDAVDAGLVREVGEFLAVMHQLDVPFFSAVGNHDNLFFGTFPPPDVKAPEWESLRTTDDFVREHDALASSFPRSFHDPTLNGLPRPIFTTPARAPRLPCSTASGFDLYEPTHTKRPGYYSVAIDLPDPDEAIPPPARRNFCPAQRVKHPHERRVVFIVLNTAAVQPNGFLQGLFVRKSAGELDDEQREWLDKQLDAPSDRCTWFLVAGHHPVDSFFAPQRDEFYERLVKNQRVLAYFAGHTHRNSIRRHPRDPRSPAQLWEIVSGSTLVHPQFGLMVDLLFDYTRPEAEAELAYLRVRSFRQRLSDSDQDCGQLSEYARLGRLGSVADQVDGDWTDEEVAIHQSNGLIPLWLR
jgi:3',5'-cyclic AMP phosphodiesterase CpdA